MTTPTTRPPKPASASWRAYAWAAFAVIAVAVAGMPLLGHLDIANIAMLFPLAVLFAAIRLGRGPAILAAFLSVALLDFFFIHPQLTFAVADLQYLITFAVLLLVALTTATLAARLRIERDSAEARGQEVARAQLAVESERLRNTLLASLSHDLRTPLTALAGLAEALTLAGPPLPARQAELAEAIRREALRTHALARNLLDLARLQAPSPTLASEWMPVDEMIGSALQAQAHALRAHRVEVDIAAGLPLLHVDAVLMERVLCNLLENAVTHTPPGGLISVRAQPGATTAGAPAQTIEVLVEDSGCGLPPGMEQAIFARFVRGGDAPAGSRGEAGSGLGLAIVDAIVSAHGGSVTACAAPGGGARFSVRLPVPAQPAFPAGTDWPQS